MGRSDVVDAVTVEEFWATVALLSPDAQVH
jgi:hypothetical protein